MMPSHTPDKSRMAPVSRRQSSQSPLPVRLPEKYKNLHSYSIFPYHSLPGESIFEGYSTLAAQLIKHSMIVLDGYSGVFWEDVVTGLSKEFAELSVRANWINAADFLKPS